MQAFELELYVAVPASVVLYEFHTEKNDIGFDIRYRAGTADDVRPRSISEFEAPYERHVVAYARHNATSFEVADEVTAIDPGVYVFRWDNTYSWMRRKRVLYKVMVQPPHTGVLPDDGVAADGPLVS